MWTAVGSRDGPRGMTWHCQAGRLSAKPLPGGGVPVGMDTQGEDGAAGSGAIQAMQPLVVPEPGEEGGGAPTATPRDAFGINSPRGSGSSSGGAARGVTLLNLAQAAGGSDNEGSGAPAVSSPTRTHTSGDGASAAPSEEDEEPQAAPGAEPAAAPPKPEGRGARSILNAFPAGLLSLAGGSGDSAAAEEAQRLRLQVRAACSGVQQCALQTGLGGRHLDDSPRPWRAGGHRHGACVAHTARCSHPGGPASPRAGGVQEVARVLWPAGHGGALLA